MAFNMPSTSYCNESSNTGICTTFPPHNSALGGNSSKVGWDSMNSSPGVRNKRIMASMVSDDPLQSATLSGPRSYILPILVRSRRKLSGYQLPCFIASLTALMTLSDGGIGFSLSISRPLSWWAHALSRIPTLYSLEGSSHGTNQSFNSFMVQFLSYILLILMT